MKKSRREFFEVFRRVPEEKEPTTWWRKNPEATASADALTAVGPAVVKTPSRRETAAPSNKIVLTLSRELLVVIAVVAALALVAAFVWGYSLRDSVPATVARQADPSADATKAAALAIPASGQLAPPYYTLRLKLPNLDHRNAQRVAADLCAMGYDAFVLPSGASSWSVNVGRFQSYLTGEAEAFKKKVSAVIYKNHSLVCSWEPVRK